MICHQYKIIFIHIPKVGGESIRSFFSNDDRNISKHATARQIRDYIGKDLWDEYFKFSFVRNPFSQVVSMYHHLRKTLLYPDQTKRKYGKRIMHPKKACLIAIKHSFNTYVKRIYKEKQIQDEALRTKSWPVNHFQPLSEWITDEEGRIIVDFVGKLESIDEDFQFVCRKIGYKGHKGLKLPHLNASTHASYQALYDIETKAIIEKFFKRDLSLFDYYFEKI